MKKSPVPSTPDEYIATLSGWHRACIEALRAAVRETVTMDEQVKWGHLVFLANGPVLLIRAEEDRVLFGFWRGQRQRGIEPRLKPGGKYEMATIALREGETIESATVRRLVKDAVTLNKRLGDPRLAAKTR